MRTIKFRAWNKFTKTMVPTIKVSFSFHDFNNDDNWILMQYTGLKDKNGTEIYEGDIVKAFISGTEYTTTVEWGLIKHGFRLKCFYKTPWECATKNKYYSLPSSKNIEVIGNIYENPDLI